MGIAKKTVVHMNVFADGPDGGNPCPVVLDGDDLTAEIGKALAARFSAETIITVKPHTPDAGFGLRYFVPHYEMEMCVHGTIAATTVLRQRGRLLTSPVKIDTLLGQISVEWLEEETGLLVTVFQFPPAFAKSSPSVDEVSLALRVPASAIRRDKGPVVSVSTARPKLMVPLASNEILDRLEPDFEALWNLCDQYETTGFYPFAEVSSGEPGVYAARQFPKRAGYNEDPATGVAACALGAYLATYRSGADGWHRFQVRQGYAMGKPSRLVVGTYMQGGRVTTTCVSGKARLHKEVRESIMTSI